jgi:hypothetical protein
MSQQLLVVLVLVAGLAAVGPAEARRVGGNPRGLPPGAARQALRSLVGGAVGGKQHIRRARGWERRGSLKVDEVWNKLHEGHGMGYLAVKRKGTIRGKKGSVEVKHYVSFHPSRRRASYQIEHQGSRTYRHLLRQSSHLDADRTQIAKSLKVEPGSLGRPLAGYAIEETRLTHHVPFGPGKEKIQVENGRYHLTSTDGQRIMPLTPQQVMNLNQLDYDNRHR